MQIIKIPGTDLEASILGYGPSGFGTVVKGDDADKLMDRYVSAGGNFLDTAHCYAFWQPNGLGASERELGASLRRLGLWGKVIVATKGGHPSGGDDYPRPDDFLSEKVILNDIQESLDRLQCDHVDLYYLHRDDGKTPVSEIIELLNRERTKGRIRYLGASNWSVHRIAEANEYATKQGLQGFVVSQIQGSLAIPDWKMEGEPTTRYITEEEIAWHGTNRIPIVAYSATGSGYFSEKGKNHSMFAFPANEARRQRAEQLGKETGYTATQVALAWLRHLPAPVFPLIGTNNLEHMEEAIGSLDITLTSEQVRWLFEG